MQDYTYSIFSGLAVVIHLILNYELLLGRRSFSERGRCYRGFLFGILAYYVFDATWGVLAGLGWNKVLYAETVFFFLSLVVFVVMWSRFVIAYLDIGRWQSRTLRWSGWGILAFNVLALALNPFNKCVYYFDSMGKYRTGCLRDPAFYLLIACIVLTSAFVFAKAIRSKDSVRRRGMMVFLFCLTMAVAMALQVAWPLTPFTSLGCLIGSCFFHVFVFQDEQTAKHMSELEKALARAHAAEKDRGMFFSIVSHDIRTQLNTILGYSEQLQYGVKNKEERDEALRSIRVSGRTLMQLVNDVLDLAQMDAGKMTLDPKPVLLAHLTDEVFGSFRAPAEKKGLELVNRAAAVPIVMLDAHRFRQILFNLVGNAIKYTERGFVAVSASYSGGTLDISVSDTGRGIAPNMLTRILDPYDQVQDVEKLGDLGGGLGLGLSICRRMVEIMGGKMTVESELGKGSTFKMHLPGVAAAPAVDD